jgi:hypothetical protein
MPKLLNWFHLWLPALIILLAGAALPSCATETNAAIPYRELDGMFQPIAAVDPAKLLIQVFVTSTNKAVRPSEISLTIHSASKGLIPVQLGTNGQVLQFPVEKDLRRENPFVVANQPAGTIELWVTIQLPPTDVLTFRYRRLADGVAEINKSIKAQTGMMLSLFAPKVQGVVFLFPITSAGKAKVEIASAAGRKEYTADRHGQVILKLDKSLLAENPEVTVSEKPANIVPDLSDLK